jgi:large subunit ribosomal protein L32
MRQSHLSLKKKAISEDQTSGEQKRPHHVSPDGNYRGRKVTTAKVKR